MLLVHQLSKCKEFEYRIVGYKVHQGDLSFAFLIGTTTTLSMMPPVSHIGKSDEEKKCKRGVSIL